VGAEVRLSDNVFVLRCVLLTIALTAACPDIGCGATDRFPAAAVDTHPAQGRTTTRLAQAPPLVDLPPGSLDTNSKNAGEIQSRDAGRSEFKQLREAPSSGSANPSDGWRLGIQTEQSLQTPKSLRKVNDCPDDDECDEYTGLPRRHPARSGLKGFRRPYIGLSITSPLH
jgi:hypothetical protein